MDSLRVRTVKPPIWFSFIPIEIECRDRTCARCAHITCDDGLARCKVFISHLDRPFRKLWGLQRLGECRRAEVAGAIGGLE